MTDNTEENTIREGSMGGNAEEARQADDFQSKPSTPRALTAESAKKRKASARKRREGEPKAARKTNILFCNELKAKLREEHPDWTKGELHTEANKRWKEASKETKAEFTAKAEADKRRYEDEHRAWIEAQAETKVDEQEIVQEQHGVFDREQKKSTEKKGKRAPATGDPVAVRPPTKARTAYALFAAERKRDLADACRDRGEKQDPKELTKAVQTAWKQLQDTEDGRAERERYDRAAKEDAARYDREYDAWWGNLSESEKSKITAENAERDEKAKRAKAEAKAKEGATPKTYKLAGEPDGLTKGQAVVFMQTFIPHHYLEGETLAWREFIEPMLRKKHPDLQWLDGSVVDKSSLVRSMKRIWKEADVAMPLPASLDEMRLYDDEAAKVSLLEPYISGLVGEIEAARKAEMEKKTHQTRVEAEERTLYLERFTCETCLVWWCVATRKPSLYALGTDMKAFRFVAEMILKRWFPQGAPGRPAIDWGAKEEDRRQRMMHWKKSESVIHKVGQHKPKPTVVRDADGGEKIVWIAQGEDPVAKEDPETLAEAREAAEIALIEAYTVKIENHLKEFMRKFTSVDGERLRREVLDKVGVTLCPAGWQQYPIGAVRASSEAAPQPIED